LSTVWSEKTTPQPNVSSVALEQVDIVRGLAQLHRYREIEPGRPAAEARDAHRPLQLL
jgi:hypothetical protein